jgi:hypothetical protein
MASSGPPDKPKLEKPAATKNLSDTTLQVQLQVHLGRTLRSFYRALVEEPLPERLLKLLDLLDEQQRKEEQRNENKSS